jgi:hypothetical protein
MNERSKTNEPAGFERRGRDDAPDEHGRQVLNAQEEATGHAQERQTPEGSSNRYTGSSGTPYEDEVQAEHEGKTAQKVEEENAEPHGEANRWFTG